jgi:hypothetical protein
MSETGNLSLSAVALAILSTNQVCAAQTAIEP